MTSGETLSADLPAGYYREPVTGAWVTLPWPGDRAVPYTEQSRLEQLPPSLGWQVIRWCEGELLHHLTGEPWRFTPGQKRFIVLWYALRPDGRWLYRSGVKRGAKGTGKDPLAGALANAELCGPVRFKGWTTGPNGQPSPVGERHRMPLVQIAANSEAQAADVLRVANGMLSADTREQYGIDAGVLRTQIDGGGRIELLTNSERSNEGDPATAIFLNESHHMTYSSGGQKLAGVARRNVGKSPGGLARLLELTNAHEPGERSVAEESFDAWQAQVGGRTRRADILYDSREAAAGLRLHVEPELEQGIAMAYSDAPWTDPERIRDEAQDPRTPVQDSVRFYFNALPTNETAWVEPRHFDACIRRDLEVLDGEAVALFLDCSKSGDATVLCGSRISDGHVFAVKGWQRPHGDRGKGWLAPREEVDAELRATVARYRVVWLGVDPSPARDDETEAQYWAPLTDVWHQEWRDVLPVWASPGKSGSSVLFDMRTSVPGGHDRNRLFVQAAERTAADIDEDQSLTHDGDPMLRQHVINARRRSTGYGGFTLGKRTRDSKDLVDFAVAMVGARMGRRLALNSGKVVEEQPVDRRVIVFR